MSFPFKGIAVDLDNTLVSSERHWPKLDAAYFPTIIGEEGWESWQPEWLRMRAEHVPMDDMLGELKRRYDVSLPVAEIKSDRERAMLQVYRENNLRPLTGAQELLAFAYAQRIPVAVASGMSTSIIESVLDHMGWKRYVKAMASTHEGEKRNKPYPDVYLLAAQRLSLAPEECVAFENDWRGFVAARTAGMRCYLIPDNEVRRKECLVECAKIGESIYASLWEVMEEFKK